MKMRIKPCCRRVFGKIQYINHLKYSKDGLQKIVLNILLSFSWTVSIMLFAAAILAHTAGKILTFLHIHKIVFG